MRDTRPVCFIIIYNIFYVVESLQITLQNGMEATGAQHQLISPLRSEEGIRNASVLPGAAASSDGPDSFRTRVKRQSKLAEASKTSNLKSMHTFFQLIRNFWSPTPLGGSHPMHPDTIRPAMRIFRAGVYDFLFPPQPLRDLDLEMWMSSLWSDEGSSEASITPGAPGARGDLAGGSDGAGARGDLAGGSDGAGARRDLGGSSVNRRVKRNKVNEAAGLSMSKMAIMFFQVWEHIWNPTPPIGRKPMDPERIKFVMRIFKTGARTFLFPPKNKWSK